MRNLLIHLVLAIVLCACSTSSQYSRLENLMRTGSCAKAASYIESRQNQYGRNDRLIYLMDTAMIHLLCGNYPAANRYFQKADELGRKLWTQSVSRHALSFVSNDMVIPYAGEDFERAMVNLFSAIAYARLGQLDEARVECRRLDSLLSLYNRSYKEKNVYKEDALGRYLIGILYEDEGSLDDAYIAYYAALQTYRDYRTAYGTPAPAILVADLLRLADAVDRQADARRLLGGESKIRYRPQETVRNKGKIVLIHLNGRSPVKTENKFTVPTPSGPVSIAFPRYRVNPPRCRNSNFLVRNHSQTIEGRAELVEDINRIAVKSLDNRKGREIAKAVARAAVKQLAIHEISKRAAGKKNKRRRSLLEIGLNVANTLVLEKADTRSWRTLPGEVYLSRLFVDPGTYQVSVRRCDLNWKQLETVTVKAGETRFVLYQSMY